MRYFMLREGQVELLEKVAGRFGALADVSRLRLLIVLKEGEATVSALTERLGISQAGTSKHLGVLKAAGLVEVRRVGNQAFHRVADERVFDKCGLVCDGLFRQMKTEHELLGEVAKARLARKQAGN
jgi:DNA-binding transcriptional ArsR family regulator